ncbi:hypothetical protein [Kitasatospora sp. NPDC097643]|uniref:hypothetical protein n=1 Tax=Kitasatospora sp. NPDC097643 TaxID=3157230 RepID=UPI00332239F3
MTRSRTRTGTRSRTRIRAALVAAVATALLAAPGIGTAEAVPSPDHHCVFEGIDLNAFLGVSERLIGPPPCREAFVGERWVRTLPGWGTATGPDGAVYPAGYTPSRPAPMDDFLAKLQGVRIVQDIGTRQEWSVTVGPEIVRRVDTVDDQIIANFASHPLRPLSAGPHTSTVFMRLSAEHCDGLGDNPDDHCLPAGEFQYTGNTPVTFFPRRR